MHRISPPWGGRALLAGAVLAALALTPAGSAAAESHGEALRAAQTRLRHALGGTGFVRVDPAFATPRMVGRRDGLLTARSGRGPREVALDYVRRNAAAFGLDADDLGRLVLVRSYRSQDGVAHLRFAQTYRGVPALDTGLGASVTAGGRLVNVVGPARPDLEVASTAPRLGAGEALRRALDDVNEAGRPRLLSQGRGPARRARFEGGDRASLVLFPEARRVRLAWRVLVFADSGHVYDSVVDAQSGQLLRRLDRRKDASGFVFQSYPGAPAGGTQTTQTFSTSGSDPWLTVFDRLQGDNAVVYSDQLDLRSPTTGPAAGDLIPPVSGAGTGSAAWSAAQQTQGVNGTAGRSCPPAGCSWNDFDTSFSWTINRTQTGAQAFYFANNFHDHLRDAAGIDFDEASGNFEVTNDGGAGAGGDPVHAQVDDGASLDSGFPDCNHSNNANMYTPPDGQAAQMQMYLFSAWCGDAGVNDVSGADDAFVVYHEYTHGLSNRLVTDPSGWGALDSDQAGAMGEAWSDWYAHDYLVSQGLETDSTSVDGDMPNTPYEGLPFRTQPPDCPVGGSCPGTGGAGSGGYTYGDFGKVIGVPEVHADGEIWLETLWDLRRALLAAHPVDGEFRVRALVTDGMRLSPPEPSYLDMRDAILQADAARGFGDHDLVQSVFTARGMGVCASTTGGYDTAPVQDFRPPGTSCAASLGVTPQSSPGSPNRGSGPAPNQPSPPARPDAPRLGAPTAAVDRRGRFPFVFAADADLRATLEVTVPIRTRRARRSTLMLVRQAVTVPRTGRVRAVLRLSPRGLRLLRRRRSLTVRVTVTVLGDRGASAVASQRVTLRLRRTRRR